MFTQINCKDLVVVVVVVVFVVVVVVAVAAIVAVVEAAAFTAVVVDDVVVIVLIHSLVPGTRCVRPGKSYKRFVQVPNKPRTLTCLVRPI